MVSCNSAFNRFVEYVFLPPKEIIVVNIILLQIGGALSVIWY